ncbi:MAG: hypothetical protein WC323_04535 [Patescibacteria group bacterium]|jgi:hypothetical protein
MDNENKNNSSELGDNQTLIWSNNNENDSEEKNREFEELAGINKSVMESVIKEINEDTPESENLFSSFKQEESQPFISNEEGEEEEKKGGEEENDGQNSEAEGVQAEFFAFSSDAEEGGSQPEMLESENQPAKISDETISISKRRIALIRKLVNNIQENSRRVDELLGGNFKEEELSMIGQFISSDNDGEEVAREIGGKIIEGVFNGQCMIGPDGKQYNVPSNYASKSKLVEGDILKLTIDSRGRFIYKQIGPIERNRIVGRLISGKNSEYFVEHDGKRWQILTASVTYFKGNSGDETVILVPKQGESNWAAVENIVNKS